MFPLDVLVVVLSGLMRVELYDLGGSFVFGPRTPGVTGGLSSV